MNTLKKVGVVGAGQMGAGIAQVIATAGYETIMCDASGPALTRGLTGIEGRLTKAVEKGTLSAEERSATLGRLSTCESLSGLSQCDLVIEAIIEQLAVKAPLFKELDKLLAPHALIVSNTSSISITSLAAAITDCP